MKTKTKILQTLSPIDNSVYFETPYTTESDIQDSINLAASKQKSWAHTALSKRIDFCEKFLTIVKEKQALLAEEITWQMGRPLHQAIGEINGVIERSEYMINAAHDALSDVKIPEKPGFIRFIRKQPLGTVFIIAPWNYPYLTAINTIIPALLAGNTVILKHASQTAKCAERLSQCFKEAGLPDGILQHLYLTHENTEKVMFAPSIQFIAFTGSDTTGKRLQQILSKRFVNLGLELGGKDAAYVREDANLPYAIENLVDGALFNSGQSCCGIERIYVARKNFDEFVSGFVDTVNQYVLGNPLEPTTTLGPVVSNQAASKIRQQVNAATKAGAETLILRNNFTIDTNSNNYLMPQVLINVNHQMNIMTEETFGPTVGIMPVNNDIDALSFINDSRYGLTGSIWTEDVDAALTLGNMAEVGTWFMNRCDYLDPALAWTGVKDTGRGITLSKFGFDQLTRKQSFHLRTEL